MNAIIIARRSRAAKGKNAGVYGKNDNKKAAHLNESKQATYGRGRRTRTLNKGFGDPRVTVTPCPSALFPLYTCFSFCQPEILQKRPKNAFSRLRSLQTVTRPLRPSEPLREPGLPAPAVCSASDIRSPCPADWGSAWSGSARPWRWHGKAECCRSACSTALFSHRWYPRPSGRRVHSPPYRWTPPPTYRSSCPSWRTDCRRAGA